MSVYNSAIDGETLIGISLKKTGKNANLQRVSIPTSGKTRTLNIEDLNLAMETFLIQLMMYIEFRKGGNMQYMTN